MRLRSIQLRNFKRLSDYRAEFSHGINVVKGSRNEMGKSTLLEGIIAALFYNPKTTSKEIRDCVSWGATRQYATSLEFEDDARRYVLQKDFEKKTIRLADDEGRAELDTFNEVAERLTVLLGTRSEKLFLSSACIRQSQVSEISAGKREIGESLEEIVTGGEENTLASQVIQKLDARVAEMKRGLDMPAKNPGILANLRSQLREATQKHAGVSDEVSRVEAQKVKLTDVNKLLAQVKAEHESALALLDKNKRRQDIEASIDRLTRDYNAVEELLRRTRAEQEASRKADQGLGAIAGFRDEQRVAALRAGLDDVQRKREDIRRDLAEREEELAQTRQKLGNRRVVGLLGSTPIMVLALAALAGGIVGIRAGLSYLLSLIVLGAALLVIATRARIALIRDRTRLSAIEERIQRMKESLDELGVREQSLLVEAGCSTVAEFAEREKSSHGWLEGKRQAELRLEVMLGDKKVEDIENQRAEAARKLAVEQARLTEDLLATRLNPEEYIQLEGKVRTLEARGAELEGSRRDSAAHIKAAKYDAEEQVRLEETLDKLQETLKHEQRRVRVYQLARDLVSQARSEVLSSSEATLEREIQSYLAIFTAGKYAQVKMDRQDLKFWVHSAEKADWVRPEELSGGVVDEFYLAFRLAVAKLIFGDKRPPLIFDDPFVNFDSVRLASTLGFLKKLSADYQIIIFTLGDSYDGVADNIILLEERQKLL
jgi:uncharacterized protein YhaN